MAAKQRIDPPAAAVRLTKRKRRAGTRRALHVLICDDLLLRVERAAVEQRTSPGEILSDLVERYLTVGGRPKKANEKAGYEGDLV